MNVFERVKSALRRSGRGDRIRTVKLNETGGELLDSTPMAPPIGFTRQPSMFDIMRKMIADREIELAQQGYETPEEADDFDVGEDFDPSSPYEHDFDPPAPSPKVPSAALSKAAEPPSDGPGTPPVDPARDGSPAPAQGGPAIPQPAKLPAI